ncbi:Thiol peroxidase, Bcp-type [Marinobacterium lacunae]|uniref:thioredoxin-dependent peroxiredoxin n=1 Tax=Marinobacterium lacunae TaxID=1232683 RepID=A0A081FU42_9GAMM|nr:thioredoxin-dependent thiol peroxidase [Marinobacterium lacunae]KEA62047.1 Thiol peroxidase, Bcp-type [Marinobacterium lacunae]MBR9883039.1 thioredoxin-dependent thiol peroxidase [Oceanospirillales bacterium]
MLEAGQPAPDFNAVDQNGDPITLSQFRGQKVVLYFYPRDNTPGCTAQACDLRDNYERLQSQGYQVIGVSTDNEKKHQNFIAKYDLPFPLIADTDNAVHELYGTWQLKKNYGKEYMGTVRTTFVIDENGTITDVIKKVKTKEHAAQILVD